MSSLQNKRIVNTRATHQAAEFDALIRARGAAPLAYPCIAIQPPDDPSALDAALQRLASGDFDWLIITSANTVHSLAQRLGALGLSLPNGVFKTAAVGPATTEAILASLGLTVDLMPDDYIAESLAAALNPQAGARICLPESAIARPTLAQHLQAAGAVVEVIKAYQTVRGSGGVNLPAMLAAGQVDAVTFTSSSTVEHFTARLADAGVDQHKLDQVALACIGPKTADTAAALGMTRAVVAAEHTLHGLLDSLETYFLQKAPGELSDL
ncbi:MAG: uroporphyrinogen-III synthase [Chloroflexi bacterium]|nr:uroporphyrinogen-III synthase [Chloroflexota bacterium]